MTEKEIAAILSIDPAPTPLFAEHMRQWLPKIVAELRKSPSAPVVAVAAALSDLKAAEKKLGGS